MNYWIVKSEPETYSWSAFVKEGGTAWTGVRNFAARSHLRAMKSGDRVFFYHSGGEKSVVGLARVKRESYPDPTAKEGDWPAVDLAPEEALAKPVTLAQIKADAVLREMVLARQPRLSVSPVTAAQFGRVLELAGMKVRRQALELRSAECGVRNGPKPAREDARPTKVGRQKSRCKGALTRSGETYNVNTPC